jgi:hypothetical protein
VAYQKSSLLNTPIYRKTTKLKKKWHKVEC